MRIATNEQMKELDRKAIEERGIPSIELMETASGHVADKVVDIIGKIVDPKVTVFCGSGNNGGDGIACARILAKRGVNVRVILAGDPSHQTKDSLINTERLSEVGLSLEIYDENMDITADAVVDALFGVGLNREITGIRKYLIDKINELECPVISCDIPSGINGNTGEVMGTAVRADETVTFTCVKPGLINEPGIKYAGNITVADIGIPTDLLEDVQEI